MDEPDWHILEGGGYEMILVNPQHFRSVPGRKTNQKDCEWLAQLLQHGLLRSSFVPAQETRELRDLTRYRVKLMQERNRVQNRIEKVLQDVNLKLSSVVCDVWGVTGRAILAAILQGEEDPERLAEYATSIRIALRCENVRRRGVASRSGFEHVTRRSTAMREVLCFQRADLSRAVTQGW